MGENNKGLLEGKLDWKGQFGAKITQLFCKEKCNKKSTWRKNNMSLLQGKLQWRSQICAKKIRLFQENIQRESQFRTKITPFFW